MVRTRPAGACPLFQLFQRKNGVTMTFEELQALIDKMYSDKDRERGTPATFLWLTEEIGELATALREGTHEQKCTEFSSGTMVSLSSDLDDLAQEQAAKHGICGGIR